MGLELRLSPHLTQAIKCRACDGYLHEHDDGCPQEELALFCQEAALREHSCPKCHRGSVALNRADFYECRSCHTLFSTGPACGEVAESLDRTYLLGDSAIQVFVMTGKGDGRFRDDEIIAMLRQGVKEAVARRKRTRRARTPSIYQRLMKEIRDEEKSK